MRSFRIPGMGQSWPSLLLGASLGITLALPARASTLHDAIPVEATVITRCVVEISTINLGTYVPPVHSATESSGQFRFSCTRGGVISVSLSADGSPTPCTDAQEAFAVQDPRGQMMHYVLFQDAAHQSVWGCAGDHVVSFTTTTSAMQLPYYGQIPAGQDLQPGTFTGLTVLTLSF